MAFNKVFQIILLLATALTPHLTNGQVKFIELGIDLTSPQGRFKSNLDKSTLIGFQLAFLRQTSEEKPLFWGIEYGYTRYDVRNDVFEEVVDFSVVSFDYRTYANLQRLHGLLRLYPDASFWGFEPYIEAQFGGKWLLAATSKSLTVEEEDTSDFNSESSSWSWSYGASIGINKSLSENIYLNLRGSYFNGSRIKYLVDKDLPVEFSTVEAFEEFFSPTPIFLVTAGVTFVLN